MNYPWDIITEHMLHYGRAHIEVYGLEHWTPEQVLDKPSVKLLRTIEQIAFCYELTDEEKVCAIQDEFEKLRYND